jgi:DNA replication protein DnaC
MPTTVELTPLLRSLRLSGVLETLEVRSRFAVEQKLSYVDFMGLVLQDENERREQKKLSSRVRRGGMDPTKTLEVIDWEFNRKLNRRQWYELATCRFVAQNENVLIVGPTGVGKSHLAQGLAHEACRRGHDVLFINVTRLLQKLNGGRADGTYEKRLAALTKVDLLIIDDFGLKPIRPPGSEDLYEVIAERYERASTILTSNRSFEEWPGLFQEPLLASAALDRLRHHAHQIVIEGESYRGRGKEARPMTRKTSLAVRPESGKKDIERKEEEKTTAL